MTRLRIAGVSGVFLGLLVTIATVKAATPAGNVEYITFKVPLELPGVTLDPGTYVFEVLNPDGGRHPMNLIRVRNQSTNEVRFRAATRNVERPVSLSESRSILIGQPRSGVARILGWYPIGQRMGNEFVYTTGDTSPHAAKSVRR